MSQPAISVENLGKRYKIGRPATAGASWRAALGTAIRAHLARLRMLSEAGNEDEFIWALRDATFEIRPGEVVGFIGRNGAGKSTLLKLLSRVVTPTTGRAFIHGRVGSLLEVGTGFHPELTGRENIYLNGAVLGMRRAEIRRVFDQIVAFSEIERFLDTPVKRYSSGMYVRLAFAVAAHLEPEILIVDEVLAVGDVQFQKKCLGKMGDVAESGRTILFVSHNLGAVRELCNRGILLERGQVIADGPVEEVAARYLETVSDDCERRREYEDDPSKAVSITSIDVVCPTKAGGELLDIEDLLEVHIGHSVHRDIEGTNLGLIVQREGTPVFCSFDIDTQPERFERRRAGRYVARVALPRRLLKAGLYTITVGVGHTATGPIDLKPDAVGFELLETSADTTLRGYARTRPGQIIVPLEWDTAGV